jgi:hypothetical protein
MLGRISEQSGLTIRIEDEENELFSRPLKRRSQYCSLPLPHPSR